MFKLYAVINNTRAAEIAQSKDEGRIKEIAAMMYGEYEIVSPDGAVLN